MTRMTRRVLPVVLALALYAGTTACGGDDDPGSGEPQDPQSQTTSEPTDDATDDGSDPSGTPTSTATQAVGLPADFPASEVPLLPGVVTGKTGGPGPDGRKGWVLEMSATGTQKSCFDEASAALVADGFTKQGEITALDTRQAQFTSADYAVILSVRADGDELCQASYEVGQVAR